MQIQELELDKSRSDLDRQRTEQFIKEQELQKKMNEVATKSRLLDLKLSETQTHRTMANSYSTPLSGTERAHTMTPPPMLSATPKYLPSTPVHEAKTSSVPLRFYQRSVPVADIEAAAALLRK